MSETKKRISRAQYVVLLTTAVIIAVLIPISLILYRAEHAIGHCSPWCFGYEHCPWCWIVPYAAALLAEGITLTALSGKKILQSAPLAVTAPAVARSRAHRNVTIPAQKKHRQHHHHHGHTLRHAKQYDATVSLKQLMQAFEHGAEVTIAHLKEIGLVHPKADGYKVLVGDNEVMDRPLTIHATAFSAQARHRIHTAGGEAIKVYT